MGKIIGIDASRNRSGGAVAHLVGLLSGACPTTFGIEHVHLWAYPSLMKQIPHFPWLSKHAPLMLNKSLIHQLLWQYFILPREVKKNGCTVLFNTDAGTVCPFKPCMTLSQDLLSFEPLELKRYGFSTAGLRLRALKHLQTKSLTSASSAVFLTRYAQKTIQKTIGQLHSSVIAHGVDHAFHQMPSKKRGTIDQKNPIRCVYVSSAALYKHQWHVIKAIEIVRTTGWDIRLLLVGGGSGYAQKKLNHQLSITDPEHNFIRQSAFVEHAQILPLLTQSNIFIFASSCESLPITLLEGMAVGLPIACSDRGPMPEILKNAGVYFDPEDPYSIAKAISTIVSHPDLTKKRAALAKKLASQYTWEKCAAETWRLLSQVNEGPPHAHAY